MTTGTAVNTTATREGPAPTGNSSTASAQVRLTRRSPAYWRVTMDNPPVNVMGPEMVRQFQDVIHAIEADRSEEHTSELQSRQYLVFRLLLEKKKLEEIQHAQFKKQPHRRVSEPKTLTQSSTP